MGLAVGLAVGRGKWGEGASNLERRTLNFERLEGGVRRGSHEGTQARRGRGKGSGGFAAGDGRLKMGGAG